MGGNAKAIDRETGAVKIYANRLAYADQLSLENVSLRWFRKDVIELCYALNRVFEGVNKTPLWENVECGAVFTGSAENVFIRPEKEVLQYKKTLGDVDVTAPVEKLGLLFSTLAEIEGQKLTETMTYVGQNDQTLRRSQVHGIFYYEHEGPPFRAANGCFLQLDFEGVSYNLGCPIPFVRFARSSPWVDLKQGIKGVAHKYLLMTLAWVTSHRDNIVVLTDKSPLFPPHKVRVKTLHEPPRVRSFSVDKGLRTRLQPAFWNSRPVVVNGKTAYKELPTSQSTYVTNVDEMFQMFFGPKPTNEEFVQMTSFDGLLKLCNRYLTQDQVCSLYKEMLQHKLFGTGQALYRDSVSGDRQVKLKIVDRMHQEFPYLQHVGVSVEDMMTQYYVKYKERQIEG